MAGAVSLANASPILTIVNGHKEASGDNGGSSLPSNPGLPTVLGGWQGDTTMDTELGYGLGISGFDEAYLILNEAADVTFQFMGAGDSSFTNSFWINPTKTVSLPGAWIRLFEDNNGATGSTTPCTVASGTTAPSCTPGVNQFTRHFDAGYVYFAYDINGVPATAAGPFAVENDGSHNPADSAGPGFFLGVDPYLAIGPYDTSGKAVYAGLADQIREDAQGNTLDHDYQDMGVRISVAPEPGSFVLLSAGLLAFVALRRRRPMATAEGLLA
ncbi:MAG: PEP-CTERM sorting domain-containing protein [Methylococcaceae bacterium]|nr:PEP-CTERM sorting domain-containing protein [Methylococcaceae bacterium]